MPRLFLSFSLALCFSIQYSSPQDKPLREIAHELETVHISEADFPPYEVPEAARPLLLAWKIGIREGIAKALSDPENSSLSLDHLKYAIEEQLKKEEVEIGPDEPNYYGQLQRLDLQLVEKIPGLLTVVSSIWIGCGEDTSLYVFQREESAWRLLLSFSAPQYTQIREGSRNLKFEFSRLATTPDWYLLVAYSPPWCTSCWSGVEYKVLRPSPEPDKPNVLFSAKGGLYRCAEQPFRLKADPNGFSVSYIDRMNFDFDLFAKVAVDRFAIRGGEIWRIPPMRQDAVDFVDHWIGLPEHDAAILVSAGGRDRALPWHRKLARLRTAKGSESYETSYEWEQSCARDGTRWGVKMKFKFNRKK